MNHPIATFKNHLLQHSKNSLATWRKQQKKRTNSKGMGSRCRLLEGDGLEAGAACTSNT